jgi:hypothetical protein
LDVDKGEEVEEACSYGPIKLYISLKNPQVCLSQDNTLQMISDAVLSNWRFLAVHKLAEER